MAWVTVTEACTSFHPMGRVSATEACSSQGASTPWMLLASSTRSCLVLRCSTCPSNIPLHALASRRRARLQLTPTCGLGHLLQRTAPTNLPPQSHCSGITAVRFSRGGISPPAALCSHNLLVMQAVLIGATGSSCENGFQDKPGIETGWGHSQYDIAGQNAFVQIPFNRC